MQSSNQITAESKESNLVNEYLPTPSDNKVSGYRWTQEILSDLGFIKKAIRSLTLESFRFQSLNVFVISFSLLRPLSFLDKWD